MQDTCWIQKCKLHCQEILWFYPSAEEFHWYAFAIWLDCANCRGGRESPTWLHCGNLAASPQKREEHTIELSSVRGISSHTAATKCMYLEEVFEVTASQPLHLQCVLWEPTDCVLPKCGNLAIPVGRWYISRMVEATWLDLPSIKFLQLVLF